MVEVRKSSVDNGFKAQMNLTDLTGNGISSETIPLSFCGPPPPQTSSPAAPGFGRAGFNRDV